MAPLKQPLFKCFCIFSWARMPLYCHHYHTMRALLQNVFCMVHSQKRNKLPTDRKDIYRTYLLTPGLGSNLKAMQRSTLSLPCWEQLWPEEPCTHPMSKSGEIHTSSIDDIWKKRQLSCELFNYSGRLWDTVVQDDWITRKGDRSHLWAKHKLLSAKMNILIRRLSSHTICSLVKFERWLDCFQAVLQIGRDLKFFLAVKAVSYLN